MKTMILVCTTALLAGLASTKAPVLSTSSASAAEVRLPEPPVFNFVHAHRQGKGGTVAWSSNHTPATVLSFTVIRTYEDPNDPYAEWTSVNTYSCTSSKNYKCTEAPLTPGFVSYKVLASMVGGGIIESEIRTLHIVQH